MLADASDESKTQHRRPTPRRSPATTRTDSTSWSSAPDVAGLHYALRVAEAGEVAIITKRKATDSATDWAQGGIAAVMHPDDSFEAHVADTLNAGAGLCREDVVRHVVERGPDAIDALRKNGVEFDRSRAIRAAGAIRSASTSAAKAGHSQRRILHHRDYHGREIERSMLARVRAHPKIRLFEDHFAIDLLTAYKTGRAETNRALGAYVLDASTGEVTRFRAPITLLATGGAGKVYLYTSNPDIASGDGIAMAYRAGATLANMEFMQFHPTCLFHPQAKSFLISEAVRGEGGILRRRDGVRLHGRLPRDARPGAPRHRRPGHRHRAQAFGR